MKKYLLIMMALASLSLAGCAKPGVNGGIPIPPNSGVLNSGEQSVKEENPYKLSDGYILEEEMLSADIYNVMNDELKKDITVESDETSFEIKCIDIGSGEVKITVNGVDLNLTFATKPYEDAPELVSSQTNDWVGVIDLDETDNYKEIVVNRLLGQGEARDANDLQFFRLTKEGPLYIGAFTYDHFLNCKEDIFVKINNKYIIPKLMSEVVPTKLVMGYHEYTNGNFMYVDKFLTGEEIADEEGNFAPDFQKEVFHVFNEGGYGGMRLESGDVILGDVSFVKRNVVDAGGWSYYTYDVKVVGNDTATRYWDDLESKPVADGTILQNVR